MNKKMKTILKTTGFTVSVFGAIGAFNKIYYLLSKKGNDNRCGEYYNSQYGKIYYKVKGNGKPLLVLHSMYPSFCMSEWDESINELSAKYKVYSIDMLGYGMSDKPKMTYTTFIYASVIKDFIENVIQKPTGLLSANNSGSVAITAAKVYSDKISKLMLVSPNGINDKMASNNDKFKRFIIELPLFGTAYYNIKTSKSAISKFIKKYGFFFKENNRNDIINKFFSSAHSEGGNARYALASFETNYMNMDINPYISDIKIPICVAWGEENKLNPISNMDKFRELLPLGRYYIFEKTKLFPHIENSIEFSNAAEDFFR